MRTVIRHSAFIVSAILVLPLVASAQQTVLTIIDTFANIIQALAILAVGVAILLFFYGLIKYIASAGTEKAKGLQTMLYGIIAIFVMVSIWGLVRLLGNTFLAGSTPGAGAPTVSGLLPGD